MQNPSYSSINPCQTGEYCDIQDISRTSSTSSYEDITEIDHCPPKMEKDYNKPQTRKLEEGKYQVQCEPPVYLNVFPSKSCQTVEHGPEDTSSIHSPVKSFTSPYDDVVLATHSHPSPTRTKNYYAHNTNLMQGKKKIIH